MSGRITLGFIVVSVGLVAAELLEPLDRPVCLGEHDRLFLEQPAEPPNRGLVELPVGCARVESNERESILKAERAELEGGRLCAHHVLMADRSLEPGGRGTFVRHERMFPQPRSKRWADVTPAPLSSDTSTRHPQPGCCPKSSTEIRNPGGDA